MIYDILLDVIGVVFKVIIFIIKKTPYHNNVLEWVKKCHIHNRLYSIEKMNKEVAKFNFDNLGRSKLLNGQNLKNVYEADMHQMNIVDNKNRRRTIQIPYMEIINFNRTPNAIINISCSKEDPLLLNKKYIFPEKYKAATQTCIDAVLQNNPKTTNDSHPRLASLKRVNGDEYLCILEETDYFTQIRSNQSLDCHINIDGRRKTIRNIERERHEKEAKEWEASHIPYDALHPMCLTSFDNSLLANAIGVSAIWCMDTNEGLKFYLMPRNKKVGIYKNKLGIPSGAIESPLYKNKPQNQHNRFRTTSLIEYLEWEMAREFLEETGIKDRSKDIADYSIEIDTNRVLHEIDMEIIPLAFTREILRGGKPQMFFLIKTEEIEDDVLKKCFRASLGVEEFEDAIWTTASISAEVACNYLYALEYIQGYNLNEIDLTENNINTLESC